MAKANGRRGRKARKQARVRQRARCYFEALESRELFSLTPTTVSLASSAQSVAFGTPITLTATVATVMLPSPVISVGTVTFTDGNTLLGTVGVTGSTATLTSVVLGTAGVNSLSAAYSGSAALDFAGSTSPITPSSVIETFAGSGGYAGDGGPATAAGIANPQGIAVDSAGDAFIADTGHNAIREVNHATSIITTYAGTGQGGYSGDGGQATAAELYAPEGIALDSAGDLFIADSDNGRIREVNHATGVVTTVAGNGNFAFAGDGAAATLASLAFPSSVAVDSAGDLFIADYNNDRVREVVASTGVITTLAGNGTAAYGGDGGQGTAAELDFPENVALNASGDLFIADSANYRIRELNLATGIITTAVGTGVDGYNGDGEAATAAELSAFDYVATDSAGDIFIADETRVREVNAATGLISTVAGNGLFGYGGDGAKATAASFEYPAQIAIDSAGDLFIADLGNDRVREVNHASGVITTIAGNGVPSLGGDGGPATAATLVDPDAIVVDTAGDVFIADASNHVVREVNYATGIITTVAGTGALGNNLDSGSQLGDGGPATAALLASPNGLALDSAGDLFIADTLEDRIREVNHATGIITTVAGTGSNGFSGDGGQATAAMIRFLGGLTLDSAGELFFADPGNNRVRDVNLATGIINTVAGNGTPTDNGNGTAATSAGVDTPVAVAVDSAGDLYIAESDGDSIREVNASTGLINTAAGTGNAGYSGDAGPATAANLDRPYGVAVDNLGDVFIADTGNNRIREINAVTGTITTLAGTGSRGYSGNGGAASAATLNAPYGIATDASGDVFIADSDNNRLRELVGTGALVSVSQAAPTVRVTDNGGAYTASAYAATDTVAGVASQSTPAASLEGTTPTLTYYSGSTATGTASTAAPSTAGTYTVVASFAGSTDYTSGLASQTFTLTKVTPTVRVIDSGSPYTGSPQPASDAMTGVGSQSTPAVGLEGITPTLKYYSGSSTTGTALAGAPSALGTYTAVASFAGSTDYNSAQSSPVTFTIYVPTTIALTTSAADVVFGTSITLTATLQTIPANSPVLSVGTVTFMDGNTVLGTVGVTSNTATLTNVVLGTAGVNSLSASYSGSAANNIAAIATVVSPNSIVLTFAGSSSVPGAGGAATAAELGGPEGIAVDSAGDVFIADTQHNVVREVNHATGIITTYAGTGAPGYSGDGGPATAATLNGPTALALDSAGNLFIVDTNNNSIREVYHSSGVITTVAGTGQAGFTGDGGPASAAQFTYPTGIALDSAGDLYIADTLNNRVREINRQTGVITTVAGSSSFGGYGGDGAQATAAQLYQPADVAVDLSGDLFIADTVNNRVREVNFNTGIITTVAGNGTAGFSGDGGQATAAQLHSPEAVAVDTAGDLFISDASNNRIREVNATTGAIITVAGTSGVGYRNDGVPATSATLYYPGQLALDSAGDLLLADTYNDRVREVIRASGLITTVAGDGFANYSGNGGFATAGTLYQPKAVAVDAAGDVFIADAGNHVVREVNHVTGVITTIAGTGVSGNNGGDGGPATAAELGTPDGLAVNSAGDLFIVDALDARIREVNLTTGIITTVAGTGIAGYNADGIPATAAQINAPAGLALDSAGDLFFSDSGNQRVREVNASTGIMTTVAGNGNQGYSGDGGLASAAELSVPSGVAVDAAGDVFIADQGNNSVREVTASSGLIDTVAGNGIYGYSGDGGPATAAELSQPSGIALDANGDLFIADSDNNRVREVMAGTGSIITLVGSGAAGLGGDGGAASAAQVILPNGVAVDAAGDVFISDYGNNRIREMVMLPVTVSRATPTVSISDAGGVYNGSALAATTTVNGSASLQAVTPTPVYYSGSAASGTPLSAAPSHAGTYTVVASFAGSVDYAPGLSSPVTFVIAPASTTLSVGASATTTALGQSVTLSAAVSAVLTPSEGTVTFTLHGTTLGSAPVSGGVATISVTNLPQGTNAINAAYSDLGGNFASSIPTLSPSSTVITLAGVGNDTGDGGPATDATLNQPDGIVVDAAGDVFIADTANNVVREVNHVTGYISTIAGTGIAGYNGDNIAATAAELKAPEGLALDSAGDLFIADGNNRIREVNHVTGVITTVAGTGTAGFSGDSTTATAAELSNPVGLAIDSAGNLFIVDSGNNRVREVLKSTGVIITVAGNGTDGFAGDGGAATAGELAQPTGVAVDATDDVFISDTNNNAVREVSAATGIIKTIAGTPLSGGFSGDGGPATAAKLNHPEGIVVDSVGDVFIADEGNNRIREVLANASTISTVVGTGNSSFNGDGIAATAANLTLPSFIALDCNGDLYIADGGDNRIREVNRATQGIATVAGSSYASVSGDGGSASLAELSSPAALAVDSAGDVFIADENDNVIREINHATGIITTVAGTGVAGFSGDGGPATAAQLRAPQGIAVDAAGDLFIADTNNQRIREVNHITGLITTIAGSTYGYNGDGIPATGAQLAAPTGVAVDAAGDVFIADESNNRVREIIHNTGYITTVAGTGGPGYSGDGVQATAAELNDPQSVTVDSAGDIFIVDRGNLRVREVNYASGIISTIAGNGLQGSSGDGGQATAAEFDFPSAIAVNANGNVFVADQDNNRIREVTASGLISTFIGGTAGFSGDGGPASAATLELPAGVAFDSLGDLFIADTYNNRIREVVNGLVVNVVQTQPTVSVTDAGGVYDNFAYPAVATVNGLSSLEGVAPVLTYYSGSAATGTPLAAAPSHAGTYTVVASFAGSTDYEAAHSNPETFVISKAALTITANNQTMPLGGPLPTLTASYAGFQGSDSPASLTTLPTLSTTATASSPASGNPYPITVGGAVDPDYNISYVAGTLTVTATLHTPTVTAATAVQNSQSTSGLIITPNALDAGLVTNFQITNITGGTLYLSNGSTPVTNGEFITAAQGAAGLKFSPTANSTAAGRFDVQASTSNTATGLGGAIVAATITVTVVPPTSHVTPLGDRTSDTSVPVSWSGTSGSGGAIKTYNILVSTDGGAFTSWLTGTTATSATYTAQVGHAYGFISQAIDAAGNVEPAHATADTTVTVTPTPWHNPTNAFDVLGQGLPIVPADALAIINYLNLHPGNSALPATAPAGSNYYDVLGNNTAVPADALDVIDYLNVHPTVVAVAPAVATPAAVAPPLTGAAGAATAASVSDSAIAGAALPVWLAPTAGPSGASGDPLPASPAVMALSAMPTLAPGENAVAPNRNTAAGVSLSTPSGSGSASPALLTAADDNQQATDLLFSESSSDWWDGAG